MSAEGERCVMYSTIEDVRVFAYPSNSGPGWERALLELCGLLPDDTPAVVTAIPMRQAGRS